MYKIECFDPNFLPHCGCDVSITLRPAQVLCLVGENGIGKTTLLRRFYESHSDDFSYVSQGPLDYLYNRKLRVLKKTILAACGQANKNLFLQAWELFQLDHKEDRYQLDLSGGEAQALKICLGVASVKEGLILDEPFQFLDERKASLLSGLLQKLCLRKFIVMVEHDLSCCSGVDVVELRIEQNTLTKGKEWTIS